MIELHSERERAVWAAAYAAKWSKAWTPDPLVRARGAVFDADEAVIWLRKTEGPALGQELSE